MSFNTRPTSTTVPSLAARISKARDAYHTSLRNLSRYTDVGDAEAAFYEAKDAIGAAGEVMTLCDQEIDALRRFIDVDLRDLSVALGSGEDEVESLRYELSDLQDRVSDLEIEEEDLEVEVADLKRMRDGLELEIAKLERTRDDIASSLNDEDTKAGSVEAIAMVCHEANRAYCLSIGDTSQVQWHMAPEWQRRSVVNGVQFLISSPSATPRDSHESWLREKENSGWKYGPKKDEALKEHPCFVPYDDLPPEQRRKDALFLSIVRALT